MTKLLFKMLIFFIISNLLAYLILHTRLSQVLTGNEVYQAIRCSKQKTPLRKVLLGDSVSRQLYNKENYAGDYYLLTTTASITLAGQYVLFENVTRANPAINEVVLISVPISLQVDLDGKFTDNYFFKPFCTPENREYLTPLVLDRFHRRKFYPATEIPLFKIIGAFPGSGQATLVSPQNEDRWHLSDVAIEYLVKMKQQAARKGIKLRIIPAPISNLHVKSFDHLKQQVRAYGLDEMFSEYFDNIEYLDDNKYVDHLHFKALGPAELLRYRSTISRLCMGGS
jgi:hypothetical protein